MRSLLLLNKFDNPLAGVRFDNGPAGVLINAGNRPAPGRSGAPKTCTGKLHDNPIYSPSRPGQRRATLLSQPAWARGLAPAYPPAPHCNTRGLTALGRHVVDRMMDLHMIVNPDHMSQAAVDGHARRARERRYRA